jgi:nucleoside-diphosphate-sugar epimerase
MSETYVINPAPKRILVTGGAGFLGSHLCDRLVALGWVPTISYFEKLMQAAHA